MLATQMSGTILVRDNVPWPVGLAIESEAFLPGWKALKNFDGYELGRKIEEANWNFFYLAGEIKVTVLGSNCSKTLRRAVKRVLAKQEKQFNALEIIKIVSKRFLGVPFMNITAHSRHIQQGICLVAAKDALPGFPAPGDAENTLDNEWERRHAEENTKRYTVQISSS